MRSFTILFFLLAVAEPVCAQSYGGNQQCATCHSSTFIGGDQFLRYSKTLHAKTQQMPDTISVLPLAGFTSGDSVSMGSAYGSAMVYLRRSGSNFFATVGKGGTEYQVAWTLGLGYRQLYLVKIDTSYYVLPVQYNLPDYKDNSSYSIANWAAYNPGDWFGSDGSVKAVDAAFRKTSWDKNCMGCHTTAGRVSSAVVGLDTAWHATWANSSSKENIVVGCEDCHGPSGTHFGNPALTMVPSNLPTKHAKLEVCGQCHSRASSTNGQGTVGTFGYPKNEVSDTYFNPADTLHPLAQFMNFSIGPNQPGGPVTWPDSITARDHNQQYQEMLTTLHYTNPFEEVVCFTCHTAHPGDSNPNDHNLIDTMTVGTLKIKVNDDDNTLCLSCHATHGPFAGISKDWVMNEPAKRDSIGMVVNQHTKHGIYDPLDAQNTGGIGRCILCHMASTATSAHPYDISTHTFAVVPPIRTITYAATVVNGQRGSINSCAASCHRNPPNGSLIASFGIGSDPTLEDWGEATDVQLADTLWKYWQAWGFTGVKEIKSSVPIAFSLSQNYPNPFNPSTKITVDLARRGNARLEVYNLLGARVATLMDGSYEAGKYEVAWMGRDDLGMQVPSGIYFYKLEAGSYAETRKMMMVK
jgi:hypothetical protein